MSATFDPEGGYVRHVVCCYRERARYGRGAGYYVKMVGEGRGRMYPGNKRVWVESKGEM